MNLDTLHFHLVCYIDRTMPIESVVRPLRQGVTLATLEGRLEYGPALQALKAQLIGFAEKPGEVLIVDLTKVQYADSAGLGMLLFLNGTAKDVGAMVRLAAAPARLLEVFQITHTKPLFILDPDVETSITHATQE